jgi:cytochrome P450
VLSGANETTRYVTAGGLLAFAQFPEQWERLRALGAAGVAAAVEEALRWTSPGVHAMRTVLRPTEIAGQRLRPGERITLWNASANRDLEVFDEPDRFLVDRSPNRHLAFGHGRHLCLGARMARCELNALFGRLAERVESVELTGTPSFTPSNFTWGVSALPLRLHGRA